MPDIRISVFRIAAALVDQMTEKYPGIVRSITTAPDCPPYYPPPQATAMENPPEPQNTMSEPSGTGNPVGEAEEEVDKRDVALTEDLLDEMKY